MVVSVILYRIVKDERFERLPCLHAGTYADDCLVQRVTQVTYLTHQDKFSLIGLNVPLLHTHIKFLSKVLCEIESFYLLSVTVLDIKLSSLSKPLFTVYLC